jgi:hypothetical protein
LPATRKSRIATRSPISSAPPTPSYGAATRPPASSPAGRRIALGVQPIPLAAVDRIIAIGSDGMMAAVAEARRGRLKAYLQPQHRAIASINSPMQCMMKEICAQCLQLQRDPVTGAETVVFSCFNQDQDIDRVDFPTLHRRLSQNGVQEKLTKLWIDRCLTHLGWRPAMAAE